jgi:hypothetical protein
MPMMAVAGVVLLTVGPLADADTAEHFDPAFESCDHFLGGGKDSASEPVMGVVLEESSMGAADEDGASESDDIREWEHLLPGGRRMERSAGRAAPLSTSIVVVLAEAEALVMALMTEADSEALGMAAMAAVGT